MKKMPKTINQAVDNANNAIINAKVIIVATILIITSIQSHFISVYSLCDNKES